MLNQRRPVDVSAFERHGQASLTQGQALLVELPHLVDLAQGDGGKTIVLRAVEVVVDIERVESCVSRAKGRPKT